MPNLRPACVVVDFEQYRQAANEAVLQDPEVELRRAIGRMTPDQRRAFARVIREELPAFSVFFK